MIAFLTGKLFSKSVGKIILDVNGIGFDITIPLTTYDKLPDIGNKTSLHIYTHITENTFSLFGFLTENEKDFFLMLIPINKIGPKVALSALSFYSFEVFSNFIISESITDLAKIPGIGKKTAERLILELKEKIGKLNVDVTQTLSSDTAGVSSSNEAVQALVQLGFSHKEAVIAVNKAVKNYKDLSLEDIIKEALNTFK